MENGIAILWLIILLLGFLRRAAKRGKTGGGSSAVPQVRQAEPVIQSNKKPIRVPSQNGGQKRALGNRRSGDASCETQFGHVHPERQGTAMRFGGRPDLEPGYMYLNGVKVLIKEADRLEFLK